MLNIKTLIDSGIKFVDNKLEEASSSVKSSAVSISSPKNTNEDKYTKGQSFQAIDISKPSVNTPADSKTVSLGELAEKQYGSSIKNENPLVSQREVYGTGGLALVTSRGQGGKSAVTYSRDSWLDDQGAIPKGADGTRSVYSRPTDDQSNDLAERKENHQIAKAHETYRKNLANVEESKKNQREAIDGAIYGSCKEYDGNSNVASEVAVGAIPFVGQAADLRDLACSGEKLFNDVSLKNVAGVGLSIVAFVPIVGDAGAALGRRAIGRSISGKNGFVALEGGVGFRVNSSIGELEYDSAADVLNSDISHWLRSTKDDGGKWMDDVDLGDSVASKHIVSGEIEYSVETDKLDANVAHWIRVLRDYGE
ncbi:MAG: hypothetical protein H7A32_06120 [Deltaproteobacteria bacterium]|nr:hypothetical protein [Deltaproteobacteria bacterium]